MYCKLVAILVTIESTYYLEFKKKLQLNIQSNPDDFKRLEELEEFEPQMKLRPQMI